MSNKKNFAWTSEHDEIFKNIRNKWAGQLELNIPNLNGNFVLEADASEIGLGAVLTQDYKPTANISRTLTDAGKDYGITDREVLAGLWAMEKFLYYLDGKEFTYVTDHKAIKELRKKTVFGSARICRWFERLQKFHF